MSSKIMFCVPYEKYDHKTELIKCVSYEDYDEVCAQNVRIRRMLQRVVADIKDPITHRGLHEDLVAFLEMENIPESF